MSQQRIFGDTSIHLLKMLVQNFTVSFLARKCHKTCILEVTNDLIIFDINNDKFLLGHQYTCHMTLFKIYTKSENVV